MMKSWQKKRILYFSDYELIVYQVKGKQFQEVQRLPLEEESLDKYVTLFQKDLRRQTILLVDTSQEEYQRITLPHVVGKDRQNLVAHRAQRLFEKVTFYYADFQGRESSGRGDDKVLLMTLNSPERYQIWLDLFVTRKIPVVAIYSVPLLSQLLLKHLPRFPYTLLLTHTPPNNAHCIEGLRQSFFINQRLQFSRLVALPTLRPREYIENLVNQIFQVQSYLFNTRMLPLSTNLAVVILVPSHLLEELDNYLATHHFPDLNIETIDIGEFARYLELTLPEEQFYLHTLVIHQLLRTHAKNHYARKADKRYISYRKIRQISYIVSVLLAVSALVVGTLQLMDAADLKSAVALHIQKIKFKESEIEKLRRDKANLPTKAEYIRGVVETGQYISNQYTTPEKTLITISQVLQQHPKIVLEHLEWQVGATLEQLQKNFAGIVLPAKRIPLSEEEDSTTIKIPAGGFIEGIRLHGKIRPIDSYVNAEYILNQWVEALRQQFADVAILLAPFDSASKELLRGQIGEKLQITAAQFTIEVRIVHVPTN